MKFGELIILENGLICPSTPEEMEAIGLYSRGDSGASWVFKRRLYFGMGDASAMRGGWLGSYMLHTPITEPIDGGAGTYVTSDLTVMEGDPEEEVTYENQIQRNFAVLTGWQNMTGVNFSTHMHSCNGIQIGDRLFKVSFLLYSFNSGPSVPYNCIYYSDNGTTFKNRAGVISYNETLADEGNGFDDSVIFNWYTNPKTVNFTFLKFICTLFDSNGVPTKSSDYGQPVTNLSGVPIYQDNKPVPDSEDLYCYMTGIKNISSEDAPNGILLARAKVREQGVWLNADPTTDPIMNGASWEFWNGANFVSDIEEAVSIIAEKEWYWQADLQYSQHHNKFILITQTMTNQYFVSDWNPEETISCTELYTSDRMTGPFKFEKKLVGTAYGDGNALAFVDALGIIAIYKDKIKGMLCTWKPSPNPQFDVSQAGYGNFLFDLPILSS